MCVPVYPISRHDRNKIDPGRSGATTEGIVPERLIEPAARRPRRRDGRSGELTVKMHDVRWLTAHTRLTIVSSGFLYNSIKPWNSVLAGGRAEKTI